MLHEAEQRLLAQLSVFLGGFTHQAVESVTATPVEGLLSLVMKSLVRRHLQDQAGQERYNLHELTRQYAAEQMAHMADAAEDVRSQHSAFYCGLLEEQESRLHGPEQQAALAHIALELDNIRTAWRWAVDHHQIDQLKKAMHSLGLFYERRNSYQEGEAAFRSAVEQLQCLATPSPQVQQVLAHALAWQAVFARLVGRLAEAEQLLQQSLQTLEVIASAAIDVRCQRAFTLLQLGHLKDVQVTIATGVEHYQQAVAIYHALADPWGEATALLGLGEIIYRTGNYAQALRSQPSALPDRR